MQGGERRRWHGVQQGALLPTGWDEGNFQAGAAAALAAPALALALALAAAAAAAAAAAV